MPGTMAPLIMLPDICWNYFPYGPTVEGQYIIKNLVLISAAIVIGRTLRHKIMGFSRFAPDEFMALLKHGNWAIAGPDDQLTQQGKPVDRVMFIHSGKLSINVDGKKITQIGGGHFIGEMSFLTEGTANATVTVMEKSRYIYWPKETLPTMFEEHPSLRQAMQVAINQDLISKIEMMDHQ